MDKIGNYGGNWTTQKLEALRSYLAAYLTALQKQRFSLLYIDAFAGPGFWIQQKGNLFEQIFNDADSDYKEYKSGSPLIALEATSKNQSRTFDEFYFIDNNREYIDELQKRVNEKHGGKSNKVKYIEGDANIYVPELCNKINWKSSRAVIFLDPFGMSVKWQTIEAIASTKAIDLWVLFPGGIGVNRMLTKSGEIPEAWQNKLDDLFGTEDWRDYFYKRPSNQQTDIFGMERNNLQKDASFERIAGYFIERLKTIFSDVAEKPLMLKNSMGNPIFSLCFAVGNKNGAPKAIRIAKSIIDKP